MEKESFSLLKKFDENKIEYDEYDNRNMINETRGRSINKNTLCDIAFLEQNIIKAPSKFLFISKGNDKTLPDGINLSFFGIGKFTKNISSDNSSENLMEIDWASIMLIIVSFVIIIVAYDAISGEKVAGTLKLINSYSLSKWHFFIGKFSAILFLIMTPIIIGILTNILLFQLIADFSLNGQDLVRILIFFCCAMLYVSALIFICFLISSLTKNPSTSILICSFYWILFVVIIPNASWVITSLITKVQSLSDIQAIEENRIEQEVMNTCNWSWDSKWLKEKPSNRIYELQECFNKKDNITNQVWNDYRNSLFTQTEKCIEMSSYFSYFSVFKYLCDKISNRGYFGYRVFYNNVKDYHYIYKNFIEQKDKKDKNSYHIIFNNKYLSSPFMSKEIVKRDEFIYFAESQYTTGQILRDIKLELFLLVIWNIVFFIFSLIAFIRYDVR